MAVYKYDTENGVEWGFKFNKILENSTEVQIGRVGFKSKSEALAILKKYKDL